MSGASGTAPPRKRRRSPRFPFDALVRIAAQALEEDTVLWGRSIDLCREGIGVKVAAELTPDQLVAVQIPLAADKPVTVRASVRYCNPHRCGLEFISLGGPQHEAIEASWEKLRKRAGILEVLMVEQHAGRPTEADSALLVRIPVASAIAQQDRAR